MPSIVTNASSLLGSPRLRHCLPGALIRGLFGLLTFAALPVGISVKALIPEPPAIVFGSIAIDGIIVGADRSDIRVEVRRADGLPIADYVMGAEARLGDEYAVRIDLESVDPIRNPLAALFGESLRIVVVGPNGDLAEEPIDVPDRGHLEEIHFVIGDPGPNNGNPNVNNGLPDDWEAFHFGEIGVSPLDDRDGDRLNALEEFEAGSDPNDANDRVALEAAVIFGTPAVSFVALAAEGPGYEGLVRFYTLETLDTLGEDWTPVSEFEGIVGDGTTKIHVANDSGSGFFRLQVVLTEE